MPKFGHYLAKMKITRINSPYQNILKYYKSNLFKEIAPGFNRSH